MDQSLEKEMEDISMDDDTPTEPGDLNLERNMLIDFEDDLTFDEALMIEEDRTVSSRYRSRLDTSDTYPGDFDEQLLPRMCEPAPKYETGVLPLCIEEDKVLFDDITTQTKNRFIKIGDTVELGIHLVGTDAARSGDFLRVKRIFTNLQTTQVTLRGILFKRMHKLNGMLPKQMNELFLVLRQGTPTSNYQTSLRMNYVDVPLSDAVRKRSLVLTNCKFPEFSFRAHSDFNGIARENIYNAEKLVCRWAFSGKVFGHRQQETYIRRIHEKEADYGYSRSESRLLFAWRNEYEELHKKYTFVDVCCGAGGVSTGAKHAGFTVRAGLDNWLTCCATFIRNHHSATVYHSDISHVNVQTNEHCWRCDAVHVSFPCQWCSAANTQSGTKHPLSRGGYNDEQNQAPVFAITQVLRCTKARILTIEETPGLCRDTRHRPVFIALVNAIVSEGWSVRWKVLDFAQYGLPQHRYRLIVYAACPGGVLPDWPTPEFGPGTSRNYTTINNAICDIDNEPIMHEPSTFRMDSGNVTPYSGDTMLTQCITTLAYQKHPSGVRNFTLRELACLQGFPKNYQFLGKKTEIMRQIGNAVPPVVAKRLLNQVKLALEKQDQELAREYASRGEREGQT